MTATQGFAAVCDTTGMVREILRNDLGVEIEVGSPIAAAVDDAVVEKTFAMLREIGNEGAATGWELTLRLADGVRPAWCAGTQVDTGIVFLAATSGVALEGVLDDLTRVNNEQTNALRAALKSQALSRADADRDLAGLIEVNNELTAAQRALASAHAELRRLNDEKDALLGMAAHDLRNPLFVSQTYAEFLRNDADLPPEARKMADHIHQSSRYSLDLVNDLLDIAAIEAGRLRLHREPTDLGDLVRRVVELEGWVAERKDISLDLDTVEAGPPLAVDGRKIEQVLHNLLGNAVKFSEPGGHVEVSLRRGAVAELVVRDHGVGMTDEQRRAMFNPFERGATGTAGERSTGLGMAIVKRIVEGHDGAIDVTSAPGVGTTIRVTLPEG